MRGPGEELWQVNQHAANADVVDLFQPPTAIRFRICFFVHVVPVVVPPVVVVPAMAVEGVTALCGDGCWWGRRGWWREWCVGQP